MKKLTILYDASCGFCISCRHWLEEQPKLVELDFVAARSAQADRRFPDLADADDLIQEAYLRLLGLRRRRPIPAPRALLVAITRNLALDALRRRRARPLVDVTEQRVSAEARRSAPRHDDGCAWATRGCAGE